jgi:hypothetical protein
MKSATANNLKLLPEKVLTVEELVTFCPIVKPIAVILTIVKLAAVVSTTIKLITMQITTIKLIVEPMKEYQQAAGIAALQMFHL